MTEKKSRAGLWILLAVVTFSLVGFVLFIGLVATLGGAAPRIDEGVLEVVVRGPLREGPPTDPFSELFSSFDGGASSLWDLRRALDTAASDPDVKGLRIDLLNEVGWGVADEIVDLVQQFRTSGKPVFTYIRGDFAGDQQYYLATLGDQLWLAPESGLMVNGLRFEVEFYKGSLEKLHVEPSYLMLEEYKSAGETFSRTEISEPSREQLLAVGEDIQRRMISGIAERREIEPEEVRSAVDLGLLTATEALEKRWVDHLGFADEVKAAVAEAVGLTDYEGFSLKQYLATQGQPLAFGDRVALVFGEGIITASGSPTPFQPAGIQGDRLSRTLLEVAESDAVKALVFRVNSPGGSAVGSDHIWRAIEKVQEAGKPVVVSMSDVAGSGGYWVSMGADRIVAQPSTITGSIGVVFGKLNIRGFYEEWLGASVSDVTLAKNADLLSLFETLKPDHEERFRAWMVHVYQNFQNKVAEGRGLEVERVAELAKGRIWSGVDAKEQGLIDEIGGLGQALAMARQLADLPDDTAVEVFPRKKSLFEILASGELSAAVRQGVQARTKRPSDLLLRISPELFRDFETPRPWVLMPRIRID